MNTKIIVYTDGSTIKNGKSDCRGGIGIYNQNTKEAISMSIDTIVSEYNLQKIITKHTNNIAELLAILKAILEYADKGINLLIKTDSMYSINCLTKWNKTWVKNKWKTANGTEVLNKELICIILDQINNFDISFQHVKAHTKKPNEVDEDWYGNDMADKLAKDGVRC